MADFAATDEAAAAWLLERTFPQHVPAEPLIGAEIEFIVRDCSTHRVALLDGPLGVWLNKLAAQLGWEARHAAGAPPVFQIPGEGTITLEPGGQLEYSSPPFPSASLLIDHLRDVAAFLCAHAASASLALESVGIDPVQPLAEVSLQLHDGRYESMDSYFASIGDAGPRMMRQTAALQINIDPSHHPQLTWSVLNRAAPVLTALFANSRTYAGVDSGWASYRAQAWRALDPARTGVVAGGAPEYARFALDAPSIFDAPLYRPFRALPDASEDSWRVHLTTLFPEVRPKVYFEVRCIDAIPPAFYAAPIVLLWALCADAAALRAAAELLPSATPDLLLRAARSGLDDAELHGLAERIVGIALDTCGRASEDLVQRAHADVLEEWWRDQSRRDVRRSSTTSSLTIM